MITPDTTSRQPVFQVCELTRLYGNEEVELRALDGASLEMSAQELVVLLGSSANDKSTFCNPAILWRTMHPSNCGI